MTPEPHAERLIDDRQLVAALQRVTARTALGAGAAELAAAITDELLGLLHVDAGAIFRFDGDEIVVVAGSAAPGRQVFTRGARFTVEPEMLAAEIRRTRAPARHATYDGDPSDAARRIRAIGHDVVIGAPVMLGSRTWGVVYVAATGAHRLPAGSEHELSLFAQLCAIAVASAEDRATLESQAVEQAALMRVAATALGEAGEPAVLRSVAEEGAALLGAAAAALLEDRDGAGFEVAAVWAAGPGAPAAGSAADLELAARVRTARAVVRVGDPDTTARTDEHVLGQPVGWAVPLEIGSAFWGVLLVAGDKGTPVPPDAAGRLQRFAQRSGLAIANARTRRELLEQAERVEELAAARRSLLIEVLGAEDRMRRQIADALHDDVLQELYAARMDLQRLDADDESLPRARVAVDAATRQLREAVGELHPAATASHDLQERLRATLDQGGDRAGFGHRLEFSATTPTGLDHVVPVVVRELVNNIVKHADATFVVVSVRDRGQELVVEVSDDGRGIAPGRVQDAVRQGHVGLASARERVEALGGRLHIDGRPGHGTRVRFELPRATAAG